MFKQVLLSFCELGFVFQPTTKAARAQTIKFEKLSIQSTSSFQFLITHWFIFFERVPVLLTSTNLRPFMIIDVHRPSEPQAEKLFKFDREQKCRRRETSRKQLLVSDCDGNNAGYVLYFFV